MGNSVSSEFGKDLGLVHEAIVTGRKAGAGKEFWTILAHNQQVFAKVVDFVSDITEPVFTLRANFDYRGLDDWKLISDSNYTVGKFGIGLVEFINGREIVGGEEMLQGAEALGAFAGHRHAEAMLREPERIPEEYKKFVLVFPETIWEKPDFERRVMCIHWAGSCWVAGYSFAFKEPCRLVRIRE